MSFYFYFFLSLLAALSITFDELSEKHQEGWNVYREDLDSAEVLFKEALEDYQEYLDVRREAVVLIDLATIYQYKGDFSNHLKFLHKSEKLIGKFEDSLIAASLFSKLYAAYSSMNNIEKSIEYLRQQRLYIADDDSNAIINVHLNTADAYMEIGAFDLAKENLDKANSFVSLADGNKKLVFNKYGYFYYKTQQPDSALKYYERAMIYYDAWNNTVDLTSLLNYLSVKHEITGSVTPKTLDSISKVIKRHNLKTEMPQFLALKANVLNDTSYLHKAIELTKANGYIDFTIDLINELANLQFKLKHYENHKNTLELYHKLKDSLSLERNKNLLDDLSEGYIENLDNEKDSNSSLDKIALFASLILVFILSAYIVFVQFGNNKRRKQSSSIK